MQASDFALAGTVAPDHADEAAANERDRLSVWGPRRSVSVGDLPTAMAVGADGENLRRLVVDVGELVVLPGPRPPGRPAVVDEVHPRVMSSVRRDRADIGLFFEDKSRPVGRPGRPDDTERLRRRRRLTAPVRVHD